MAFPICNPEDCNWINQNVFDLGVRWANDPSRPQISPEVSAAWSNVLAEWVADKTLPLLVRRFRSNRGSRVTGQGGRALIPTDNSPAQWAFAVAHSGSCPHLSEIASLLETGRLPVAMALNAEEKARASYKGIRGKCPSTSDAGWKLAHIEGVALEGHGSITEYPARDIERHFTRLMSPSNMLVVPAGIGGLAEVAPFIDGYRSVVTK